MEKLKCSKCGEEKPINEFGKQKSKKNGRQSQCKTCKYAQDKVWREANKEKKAAMDAKWYSENKERASKQAKERYQNNREEILANLRKKRKDPEYKKRKAISDKKWKAKNVEHLRKYFRDRARRLRKTDPNHVLVNQVRRNARRVNAAAAGKRKRKVHPSSLTQLGCTIKEYRAHIESLWEDWMNWDNYGPDPYNQWQLDHKIPLDWFVKNSKDVYKAGHYTNIQPMRGIDNQRKSNKMPD